MPQTTYLADNSYIAIKPETTPGVAVIPTIFLPLVSENIKTIQNLSADRRMKGIDWKSNDLLRGNRTHEGEIVMLGDPTTFAHILNMTMAKGATSGNGADGYTHPFTIGTNKTYTIEIKKGLYAQRYFGVQIDDLKITFSDGQMELTAGIKAYGQFAIAEVGVATAGAVTSLTLSDVYDIAPNRGLVIGDVIVIGAQELTLTSVNANELAVGFTSTSITSSVGDKVYLKPQSATQSTLSDPFYFGNIFVGTGVDETAATIAAGARTTSTQVYEMTINFKNNLFQANGNNRMDPAQIMPRTKEASIEFKHLFDSVETRQKWLARTKTAITIVGRGHYIKTDYTTQEAFTFKFYNTKLIENENPLEVGEFIYDQEMIEVLYDNTAGKAFDGSVINKTAGTVY